MNWVNLDADFGAPMLRLIVDLRKVATDPEYRELRVLLDNQEDISREGFAGGLAAFIERRRPDLRGLSLLGISRSRGGMSLEFDVVHPSAKRVAFGNQATEQNLDPCWCCGRPIDRLGEDGQPRMHFLRNVVVEKHEFCATNSAGEKYDPPPIATYCRAVEVCSEACVAAERGPKECRGDAHYTRPDRKTCYCGLVQYGTTVDLSKPRPFHFPDDGAEPDRTVSPEEWGAMSEAELREVREQLRRVNEVVERTVIGVETDMTYGGPTLAADEMPLPIVYHDFFYDPRDHPEVMDGTTALPLRSDDPEAPPEPVVVNHPEESLLASLASEDRRASGLAGPGEVITCHGCRRPGAPGHGILCERCRR